MELLAASYEDGSNTPKTDRNGEDSSADMTAEYNRMMNSLESDVKNTDSTSSTTEKLAKASEEACPWIKSENCSEGSSSGSDSSSDEDSPSGSEDESKPKQSGKAKRRGSESTDYSSDSSTASGSGKSEHVKESAKQPQHRSEDRDRRASSSSHKASSGTKRSRSRSGSKGRRVRRSSDRRRRSHSHSRDHRHKSSRSERRTGHHSRSRSRSKDRHSSRRHSSRERRRRDGHRRRRSGSRDEHPHRRRHSSSHRRRHHSRSPDHKKSHTDKKRRSRSPHSSRGTKEDDSNASRHQGLKSAGLKFGRGRSTVVSSYKEQLKQEYIQNYANLQEAVNANPDQPIMPPVMQSNVATQSAGTGVMIGMAAALLQQQMQKQCGTMPGMMSAAEKVQLNQRMLLIATGRTREQVEAKTGVKLPQMYNESNVNLLDVAIREKKKTQLWKAAPAEKKNNPWSAKTVLPGANQSEIEKFQRLMGNTKNQASSIEEKEAEEEARRQMELNARLMEQYEHARNATHINRGTGLGYSSTLYQAHN